MNGKRFLSSRRTSGPSMWSRHACLVHVGVLFGLCVLSLSASGCGSDTSPSRIGGFVTMGPTEHGVIFSALPPILGGGVREKVVPPRKKEFLLPWEHIYRVETGIQSVSWGEDAKHWQSAAPGESARPVVTASGAVEAPPVVKDEAESFLQTRASDGNEVKLAMAVIFRIIPEKSAHVVQYVAPTNDDVVDIVKAVARGDIRTHMNALHTADFFNERAVADAVHRVKDALNTRFKPEGIEVLEVLYIKHRFSRQREDGTEDDSYQSEIDDTERTKQKINEERNRQKTVEQEMRRLFVSAEGEFNQLKERVDADSARLRAQAEAEFGALKKDAERIAAVGNNEVEGLAKQLEATASAGARSRLRLEVAKALIENKPKFVVINQGTPGGLDFHRTDTNELLRQFGLGVSAEEMVGIASGGDAVAPKQAPTGVGEAPPPARGALRAPSGLSAPKD